MHNFFFVSKIAVDGLHKNLERCFFQEESKTVVTVAWTIFIGQLQRWDVKFNQSQCHSIAFLGTMFKMAVSIKTIADTSGSKEENGG